MAPVHGLFAIGLAGLVAACNTTAQMAPADFFADESLEAPVKNAVTVCHGFGCRYKSRMPVAAADLKTLKASFAKAKDAREEREAISKATVLLETRAGQLYGTSADLPGGTHNELIGDPTQQDCVDESSTTTGYLTLLEDNGFLKFHQVRYPAARGIFIDGRYQHYTAVIRETAGDGTEWTVDTWFRKNAQPPVIMPLKDWLLDWTPSREKQLPEEGPVATAAATAG